MTNLGQPRGLYVLFFAEAWERFSYYGMRALLVLYMCNQLKFARADALGIYATYTGLVYLTPIFGGYLADRVLGARKAVIIGGLVMALGHLAMAFEPLLYIALGLLILGNGFFKPNISTIVGGLYEQGDPRRDGGFTIFYMGINLGAFFSPLVCGTLGERFGWHFGFSAASVGMILGLLVFLAGQRQLGPAGYPPGRSDGPERGLTVHDWEDIAHAVGGAILVVLCALQLWQTLGPAWIAMSLAQRGSLGIGLIVVLEVLRRLWARSTEKEEEVPLTGEERERILVICILAAFVIFFWVGFEQAGGTMTLFADKHTARQFLGFDVPASYFQAINPLGILLLAPFFSWLWLTLDRGPLGTATPTKMAIGLLCLGLGFVIMAAAQARADAAPDHLVGPGWLAAVYLVHTAGELCLSPIGLSMVTKLAPTTMVSLLMGVWFVSSALANYLAGRAEELLAAHQLPLWTTLIVTSFAAGLLLLLLSRPLQRWAHGRG